MKKILSTLWDAITVPLVWLSFATLLYLRRFPGLSLSDLRFSTDISGPPLGPSLIALVIRVSLVSGLTVACLWLAKKFAGRFALELGITLRQGIKTIVIPRIVGVIETLVILSCAAIATRALIMDIRVPEYMTWRAGIEASAETLVGSDPILNGARLVAHAGGGIDGHTYTNSIEAVRFNYDLGHKAFELDLNLMSDGEILCVYDIGHLNSITGLETTLADTDSYLSRKVYGSYSVIPLSALFEFMRDHDDVYLVTDSKTAHDAGRDDLSNAEYNARFWSEFVRVARSVDPAVLDRVVPQLYYGEMLEEIEAVYAFRRYILTLYATSMTADEVVRFAYEHPEVSAITLWSARLDEPGMVSGLRALSLPIYVHTINDLKDVKFLMFKGAYGVYTDFLLPGQLYTTTQ